MNLKSTPLITIITATYNSASVIERCSGSIANQTYRNFEFIIVDAASTDGTVGRIKKHNNQISKWISEPDTGIYDAWNKGLELATGEWIAFLGSINELHDTSLVYTFCQSSF